MFTHGDQYIARWKQKREIDGKDYGLLTFEEFVKSERLTQNKYAIGPHADKANFVAVKIENDKHKKEEEQEREEMVEELLKKMDRIVTKTGFKKYDGACLPDENLVLPRFNRVREVAREGQRVFEQNIQPHLDRSFNVDLKSIIIAVVVVICAFIFFILKR